MNRSKFKLSILSAVLIMLCTYLPAQNLDSNYKQIVSEGERIAILLDWDSSFVVQLNQSLINLSRTEIEEAVKEKATNRLLEHYQSIERNNKSRVKLDFEESTLNWLLPIASLLADEDKASSTNKIIKGFPDTYYPCKILAPELLTDSALTILADLYPKQVLYNVRFMTEADALQEIELAAINAPYEAKQYLHYSNNVKKLIYTSTNDKILKLLEIYDVYRFSSKSFYLLDLIYHDEITIEAAHQVTSNRDSFYNELIKVYVKDDALARYEVAEKLSEITDKYVRKLMYQRYLPSSMLKMEPFETLSREAKIYYLFNSQNLLKKKDLQNLAKLYKRENFEQIGSDAIRWLPTEIVSQFEDRINSENLKNTFDPYIKYSFWTAHREKQKREAPNQSYNPIVAANPDIVPVPVPAFRPYPVHLSFDDKEYIKYINNPYEALKDLSIVTNQLYSRKIIMHLSKDYPVEIISQLDKFIDQPYVTDICKSVAEHAPLTVKNYIVNKNHKIHYFLQNSQDTTIKTLYHIDRELGNWTRAYILLEKIVNQEISLQEANLICKDQNLLIPHLLDIFKRPTYDGAYTVNKELEYIALDFIRNFNISENTDLSYRSKLKELDAKSIYAYLVFGEQEIISTTFNKMYDQLSAISGNNFSSIFEEMNYKYVDQFVRMAVHYGKEHDLFRKLSDNQYLLAKIFKNLEQSEKSNIESAVDAADIIVSMNDRNRLVNIQSIIKEEYERLGNEQNDKGIVTYGILAAILSQRLNAGWSLVAAPHYKIPDLVSIPVYTLFDENLINVQQYYFYNDQDGISSYRNFRKQYDKSSYNWDIDDMGNYIKITSKSGKTVEIYANKPEKGEAGIEQLEQYLMANALYPKVVVHRGLSTHTLKTFNRVPPSTKLILDGSCGGFHIQSVALENAPGAQILCNRNIGTMYINDPMFKQISESIRQGKDIVWPNFWSDMEARLGTNPYFKDYIPPHKNVAAIILKAYYDVLDINN